MTDLTKAASFSIEATASITKANDNMIACGVRLLFVTAENGDLVGLITATDLLGEKPFQYITEHGGTRDEIIVKDIMTKKDALELCVLVMWLMLVWVILSKPCKPVIVNTC